MLLRGKLPYRFQQHDCNSAVSIANCPTSGVDSYQHGAIATETGAASVFAADASVLSGWVQEYPQYHLLTMLIVGLQPVVVMPKVISTINLRCLMLRSRAIQ